MRPRTASARVRRIEDVLESMSMDQARRWPALYDALVADLGAARIDAACDRYDWQRDCAKDARVAP